MRADSEASEPGESANALGVCAAGGLFKPLHRARVAKNCGAGTLRFHSMKYPAVFLLLRSLPFLFSAAVAAPLAISPPPAGSTVLFDVDLTRGSAGRGVVTGGEWAGGWRCTGAKDERIVFDAGRAVANGCLEVTFTANAVPWAVSPGKCNYLGLHEDAALSQNAHGGDLFYARTGNAAYRFSNFKAAGRSFDRSEHEPRLGAAEQWVCDGRTEMTVRLAWRDGVPIVTLPDGATTVFPRDVIGGDTPVDRLRYAFIGSDRFSEHSVKGLCFKRVRLIDYGAVAEAPAPTPLRVSENGRTLHGVTVRNERWRYSEFMDGGALLTDLDNDPQELKNVAEDPKNAGVRAELSKLAKSYWATLKPVN